MKKAVFTIIIMLFVLVSCSTVKTSTVTLNGNPTTGYQWSCEIKDSSVVSLKSSKYTAKTTKSGMVGVGGQWDFVFTPVNDGSSVIVFNYARSWENESIDSITYLATVSNGKLTLKQSK